MEWFWKVLPIGAVVYFGFAALIYFKQPEMLFYPDISGRELVTTPQSRGMHYENIELVTSDNIKLHGWFIFANKSVENQKEETVLFFHGNAGNISHRLDSIEQFHQLGLNVFIIDYRGYGQSTGKITETGTYRDAEAAWLYLTKNRAINENEIIIFGRSLGASIAAWLAQRVTPAGLIIESSFSSVPSMGQRFYPFLPVRLLSRFQYDTKKYIKAISCPVLVAHSREDEIIPYGEGMDVFNAAPEPKQFLQMRGGHNDGFIVSGSDYVNGIESFINKSLRR
ncbi:MAG: alpha/beta hydrolase [Gammaproteobacteria bacterium]|nr:alpha/beta hydrolase [Gammaproteobacteria bacterium]